MCDFLYPDRHITTVRTPTPNKYREFKPVLFTVASKFLLHQCKPSSELRLYFYLSTNFQNL